MKYLAFDLGLAHTGVAISYEGKIAVGLTNIDTTDFDHLFKGISNLLAQHQPDVIILGAPAFGPIKILAEDISGQLEAQLKLKAIIVDEDFTSRIAQKVMVESGAKRSKRQQRDHQVAAAAILQSYLDSL